jgi:site-specific recombinase XerD
LSEDELKRLINLKLSVDTDLERARDVFVWNIFSVGMRISDVLLLKKSNIERDFIVNRIKKTGTPHRIKMPVYANQILQKYLSRLQAADGYFFQMIPDDLTESDSLLLDRAVCLATSTYNKSLKNFPKLPN